MRKRLKKKLRSCPMCKPHKTMGTTRWKNKELQKLKIAEKSIQEQEQL